MPLRSSATTAAKAESKPRRRPLRDARERALRALAGALERDEGEIKGMRKSGRAQFGPRFVYSEDDLRFVVRPLDHLGLDAEVIYQAFVVLDDGEHRVHSLASLGEALKGD
jgi:hypothetical protein